MPSSTTPTAPPEKIRPRRGPRRKRTRLTLEQQKMVARYLPLARKLSQPTRRLWPTYASEIESAADLALVEAVESFDPARNVNFATWARIRIAGAMHDVFRKLLEKRWRKRMPNSPRTFHFVPGFVEAGLLMLTSPQGPVGAEVDAVERVDFWLSLLPPRHAHVCRELYLKHRSQTEVASEIGLAKSRICTIHAEALQLLRELSSVQEAALDVGLDVARN